MCIPILGDIFSKVSMKSPAGVGCSSAGCHFAASLATELAGLLPSIGDWTQSG